MSGICRLILLAAFTVRLLATTANAQSARNVLVMVSDDQGSGDAGCYGNTAIKTPALDALAKDGVRFTHGFAAVSSCSPSRSVILSGLLNHTNGMYGLQHADHHFQSFDWVRGLPRLLNDAGYRTGIIGKYHVGPEASYPFQTKVFQGIQGNRGVAQMADKAREFFAADAAKPFFMYFCFSDPHRAAKGFGNDQQYVGVQKVSYQPEDVRVPYHLPNTPDVRADLADYYESVSRMDQGVGMVMKALQDTKHLDDTLVIFVSDNGIPFPGAKTTLYDAGIRLPFIVRSPTQKKRGLVNDAMVSYTDITPTVLDWTGAKPPPYKLHGRSFLPILEQEHPQGWDLMFASHIFHEVTMYYPMRAIRTRKYKLIHNLAHDQEFPSAADLWGSPTWQGILQRKDKMMGQRSVDQFLHRPEFELYDLEKDPNELKNVANDPACATAFADLRAQLRKMMEETKDPWVVQFRGGK